MKIKMPLIGLMLLSEVMAMQPTAQPNSLQFGCGLTMNSIFNNIHYAYNYLDEPFSFLAVMNIGSSVSVESTVNYRVSSHQNRVSNVSLGWFYRQPHPKFTPYYGVRLGRITDTRDFEIRGVYITPTVGSTLQMQSSPFHIGSELGLRYLRYQQEEHSETYSSRYLQLTAKFLIRYYFN